MPSSKKNKNHNEYIKLKDTLSDMKKYPKFLNVNFN